MKDAPLDTRSQRMLELLAQGAGSKLIAKELGYQDGTMRVYLHNLYRKIGVANKTEAVIWYLKRGGAPERSAEPVASAPLRRGDDLFGDMAVAESLYAALGVMGAYLGPWGRVWEVGARLSGEDTGDPDGRRARSRALWDALLEGDFAHGKAIHDADGGYAVLGAAASDAVMLAALLEAGGFSHAAQQIASKLTDRRRARPTVAAREAGLLDALFDAMEAKDPAPALARLQKSAEGSGPAPFRQLAMVMLFHAARARRDAERARQIANALWIEAEGARKDLAAAGDQALGAARAMPTVAKSPAREREKAAAR